MKMSLTRKSRLLAVSLAVLLALSLGSAGALLTQANRQEKQLASLRAERETQEAQTAQLRIEQERLNGEIAERRVQIARFRTELARLNSELTARQGELNELTWNVSSLTWKSDSLEEYIIQNGAKLGLDLNDDARAPSVFFPKRAIAMLDTFAEAISAGDKALYLSVMPSAMTESDDWYEYLLSHFERRKNTPYTVTGISGVSLGKPDGLGTENGGGLGYVSVTITDDKGNEEFLAIGMTQDYFTGEWVIYDFD
jgi:hypothetical protein